VTFTDAQTAVIQKMVETGKIAEAQSAILDKLQGTMGSAAEAARDTLGGALQALQNSFDNLLEGDSGDAGVVGTRDAIEDLIKVLNDPTTKAGFDAFIGDLVKVAGFAVKAASAVGGMTQAVRDAVAADNMKSYLGLLAKRTALEDDLADLQSRNQLRQARLALGGRSGEAYGGEAGLKAAIADVDALLAKQREAAQTAQAHALATAGVAAAVDFLDQKKDPKPEGEGVPKPPKAAAHKSDPNSDIKGRIASLKEEAALLDTVADGEMKASEAAKVRYDITEGEFKNKSPQMKAELLLAAEALDQKNADIEAEKKRQEAFKKTQDAYEQLVDELRTPAEAALDKAIEEVDTLNAALKAGIATQGQYHDGLARIAGGIVEKQPDFQGLAPEVGGAMGEIGKLDQATTAEEKWYADSLARLQAFRDAQGGISAAADVQAEQVEAAHQARMQQIEGSRQQAALTMASNFFGQIAELQHSQNSKAAAVGKAAAIAQAVINTYLSATEAYKAMVGVPYVGPALAVAAAAAAVAAGLANVAAIRSQSTGYATGGYTGHGGKYQPAGIVHKGEGVLSQEDIAALGGPSGFHALRDAIQSGTLNAWAGFADGGFVSGPVLAAPDYASFPQGGAGIQGAQVNNAMRVYLSMNQDELVEQLSRHPKFEKKVVAIAGENGRAITANW
jgi:hypothetical protein